MLLDRVGGRPVADVEDRKAEVDPQEVVSQIKRHNAEGPDRGSHGPRCGSASGAWTRTWRLKVIGPAGKKPGAS
jgi:hypothetical protein